MIWSGVSWLAKSRAFRRCKQVEPRAAELRGPVRRVHEAERESGGLESESFMQSLLTTAIFVRVSRSKLSRRCHNSWYTSGYGWGHLEIIGKGQRGLGNMPRRREIPWGRL